jgi:hypothetical protein
MTFTRRPYLPMYQFLLDDFHAHLAHAKLARKASNHAKAWVDLEKAHCALIDFQLLLDEDMPRINRA